MDTKEMFLKDKSSSVIDALQYIADTEELLVSMKTGKKYAYHKVPAHIAINFKNADSLGKFFNMTIKGTFNCHEIYI